MKKIVFIFFCLIHISGIMAQKCIKELAALPPSVYEKSIGYNEIKCNHIFTRLDSASKADFVIPISFV